MAESMKQRAQRCRRVLIKALEDIEWLPICSENMRGTVDPQLAAYLQERGHEEFMSCDVTEGYQIGGLSENVLVKFVHEGRVFDGKSGRFKLKTTYGPMSVRSFEAWPVK